MLSSALLARKLHFESLKSSAATTRWCVHYKNCRKCIEEGGGAGESKAKKLAAAAAASCVPHVLVKRVKLGRHGSEESAETGGGGDDGFALITD